MMKSKLYALAAAAFFGLNANAQDLAAGQYYIQNVECGKYISAGAAWGTRSVLFDQGVKFNVTVNNGAYTLQSGITGETKALRPSDGFMDQSGTWEVISNNNGTFKIKGSAGFLRYNGTDLPAVNGAENESGTDWKFVTDADRAALLTGASETSPKDATFYIQAPDFLDRDYLLTSKKVWGNVVTGSNGDKGSGSTIINGTNGEMFNKPAGNKIEQTLTVPNGVYKVSCLAFYRAGAGTVAYADYDKANGVDKNQNAWLFANDSKEAVKSVFAGAKSSATGGYALNVSGVFVPNSQAQAAACFVDNTYLNEVYVEVTDGTLRLGIEKTGNVDQDWCLFDCFRLTYYGEGASIVAIKNASAVAEYKEALASAQSYQSEDMDSGAKAALNKAITDNTLNLSDASLTADQLTTAATKLKDAASAASVAAESYKAFAGVAKLIQDGGGKNVDLTSVIKNNSFESDFANWTNNGLAIQGNTSLKKDGAKYAERWQPNGTFSVEQSVKLPTGYYDLTVHKRVRGITTASLYANANVKEFEIGDGTYETDEASASDVTLRFHLDNNSDVKIGVNCVGTGVAASWFAVDNFRLTYVGETITYDELVAVTGKMNNDIASAQTNAIAAFNANKTDATYEAAQKAIDAAGKSVKAYEAAAPYLTKASVLDAAGQASYAAAAKAFIDSYNNGTLVELDDATKASLDAAFVTATKAQTSDGADMSALAPATWACAQGNGPAPQQGGFETYMGGKDKCFVPGDVISQTISELKNGLYRVEIQYLTHLATWDGQVGSGDGIAQVYANDVTKDVEVVADNNGTIAPISIEALVKDGTLQYGIQNIANGGSWYVAKLEKLTFVRDLTEAEKAVAPTAITLNAASAALKPGQQTTLAVATITPDNATETVTWSSSDDKVATVNNGVVTAVGEGTATITATSAIDTSIKATATVSVAYPSELANASFDEADAATEDLGTNGSAANTKDVSEWTSKGGVWTAGAAFAYGDAVKLNGADIPAADETHKGNALGVSVGWGAEVVFSQTIKLPAGNYTISADAYNAGSAAQGASKLGFVAANGTSYISEKNSYTIGEWETDKVTFKLTEATVGQIQIGLGAISGGSGSNAKVFFDNIVITTKTDAEIEAEQAAAAAKALAEAKDAKKADFDKLAVGDGLFYYSAASVAAAKANVDKAATIEAVAAVAAPVANAPQAGKAYAIKNTTADGYLTIASEGIKVTENAPVYFEAVDGGYVLSNGEEYLSKKSGDTWTLNTTTDKAAALKVNVVINDGKYEIKNANGSLGLDNTTSGSAIYANKNVAKNGLWTIEDWVAPATPELAITDGTAITAEADKTYDMTYTRSFSKANSWQSLALPVEFVYNDESVELAMFTGASVEDDGTTVINIAKVKVGDVIANNKPLLISAKTAGTKEIALGEATLYNAFEKGQAIDNEGNVVITNVLTAKKTGIAGKFVMSGGALKVVGDDSNKLGVNRWFMTINVPSGAEVRFRIEGFDGVEATGIASAIAESLGAKAYSINGAQVDASNAKGVYIQNGKKFIRK